MMPVEVAVGVIVDSIESRVVLARRAADAHQGGLWEFPGGKVERAESPQQALVRELREELDITATEYRPLLRVEHAYDDKFVALDVWLVNAFEGEPRGAQGQALRWVEIGQLAHVEFPAANRAIVDAVQSQLC